MDQDHLLEHENAARILQEAWQLFQQKGYRGVSIDELCLRCGLTKPTLYYYFHDKETLFVEVLEYRLQGFHATLEHPGSLVERLERHALSILESFQNDYMLLLRDREHIKAPEHQQRIRDAFRRELFGPLVALMEAGMAQGELASADPEFLTLVYLGMVNNFITRSQEPGADRPALAAALAQFFYKGAKQ